MSSSRPVGTTAARGSKVGRSPGRPKGTTEAAGSHTGVGGGRPSGAQGGSKQGKATVTQLITAAKCEDETWCTDKQMLNVSATKLTKLKSLSPRNAYSTASLLGKPSAGSVGGYSTAILAQAVHISPCHQRAFLRLKHLPQLTCMPSRMTMASPLSTSMANGIPAQPAKGERPYPQNSM